MGVAVPRAPVVTRSPEPPQKFGHGPLFVGQLLSRHQVSQNNQGEPPPPLNNCGLAYEKNFIQSFLLMYFCFPESFSAVRKDIFRKSKSMIFYNKQFSNLTRSLCYNGAPFILNLYDIPKFLK